MQIKTHKSYDKAWARLNKKQQKRALLAIQLLITEPNNPKLRLHRLRGEYYPQYSISVGGDLRIHLLKLADKSIILMLIGTHAQLYE